MAFSTIERMYYFIQDTRDMASLAHTIQADDLASAQATLFEVHGIDPQDQMPLFAGQGFTSDTF